MPSPPTTFQAVRTWSVGLVNRAKAGLPPLAELRADLLAGVPGAISSVPDGMAAAVVAGVSPVHGLYASFAGPIGGGMTQSTRLMIVTTTSAAALAAGSAVSGLRPADRPAAIILLSLLAGVLMIAAGVAKLGRFTRFVPHSVMIGFLSGVSINIMLGQLGDLLSYDAHGRNNISKAWDVLTHLSVSELPSLATGLAAIAIVYGLAGTRLSSISALIALIVPTALVVLFDADSVARVKDSGEIPPGIPFPHLPSFSALNVSVLVGAFSVAVIVLVQGAGVAEAAPNPDGSRSRANRDFIGQGAGNLASSVFQGQPVGGSVGQTALSIQAGARGRFAAICAGFWMLVILLLFAKAVGVVAMPTLAGVLIVAAIGSLRVSHVVTIWRTSTISRIGLVTTFLATLLLPVAAAVGIGVAVALLLQLNQDAIDLRVVELVPAGPGQFAEQPSPRLLPSHQVTVLDVYGSLYYAGSRTLQSRLPDPTGSEQAAVVLRLRGRTTVGSTFVVVLQDYLDRLRAGGGALYLSGVDQHLFQQISQFNRFDSDDFHLLAAEPLLGASTQQGYDLAVQWLDRHGQRSPD